MSLNEKVLQVFETGTCVVDRGLRHHGDTYRKLPPYVRDFLVARYVQAGDPAPGLAVIDRIVRTRLADTGEKEWAKSKIMSQGRLDLLGFMAARFDQGKGRHWASVPVLGDDRVCIAPQVLDQHGETLLTTGAWGTMTIQYQTGVSDGSRQLPFVVTGFDPLQVMKIDLNQFRNDRQYFSSDEWVDLLLSTIGFDAASMSYRAKIVHLCRLIAMVEPGAHMVELGPTQTGKTYAASLSNYVHVLTGSQTSIATLFYNKQRRRPGLMTHRDVVLFDEITTPNLFMDADIVNMLKTCLADGTFSRDDQVFTTEASVCFTGNIEVDRDAQTVSPRYRHLFEGFPASIRDDRAFLDRITGLIPGWEAPKVCPDNYATDFGFITAYYAEVLHQMRQVNFKPHILRQVTFDGMSQRDQTAVQKVTSGLLKIVFPHRSPETLQSEELRWALDIGVELRQRVLDQLAIIAPTEFKSVKLGYQWKAGGR